MKKYKEEKGITLIVLIITVIIMLILAVIAIDTSLEGGLFTKSKKASKDTQAEADRQELLAAIYETSGKGAHLNVNETNLRNNLSSGWEIEKSEDDENIVYICVSPNNNCFTVDSYGQVTEGGNTTGRSILEKYLLGGDKQGIKLENIIDENMEMKGNVYIENPKDEIQFLTGVFSHDFQKFFIYIKYKDIVYNLTCNFGTIQSFDEFSIDKLVSEKLVTIGAVEDNFGKYVNYDANGDGIYQSDELYIILYNNSKNGLQIMCVNPLREGENNLEYGIDWTDEAFVNSVIAEVDLNGNGIVDQDGENWVYVMNHEKEILNDLCKDVIINKEFVATDTRGEYKIRSIGSNPNSPYNDNPGYYETEFLETIPGNNANYPAGTFNGKVKKGDQDYLKDFDRMVLSNSINVANGHSYYLLTRNAKKVNDSEWIDIYFKYGSSAGGNETQIVISNNGITKYSPDEGIRPVITLKSNVVLNGEGTAESPFTLSLNS